MQDKKKLLGDSKIAFLNVLSLKCLWYIHPGGNDQRPLDIKMCGRGRVSLETEIWKTLA